MSKYNYNKSINENSIVYPLPKYFSNFVQFCLENLQFAITDKIKSASNQHFTCSTYYSGHNEFIMKTNDYS